MTELVNFYSFYKSLSEDFPLTVWKIWRTTVMVTLCSFALFKDPAVNAKSLQIELAMFGFSWHEGKVWIINRQFTNEKFLRICCKKRTIWQGTLGAGRRMQSDALLIVLYRVDVTDSLEKAGRKEYNILVSYQIKFPEAEDARCFIAEKTN